MVNEEENLLFFKETFQTYIASMHASLLSMTFYNRRVEACVFNNILLEICVLLEFYAAWNVNLLPMFRTEISVPSSWVKKLS
jgi:hypothetical protein